LIENVNAACAVSITFNVPLLGVVGGFLLLGEHLTPVMM
jgi:drug/metabolite transporter (DMT)-like permease